jgi:cytochrome c oxidase cbb3-type subunit 3
MGSRKTDSIYYRPISPKQKPLLFEQVLMLASNHGITAILRASCGPRQAGLIDITGNHSVSMKTMRQRNCNGPLISALSLLWATAFCLATVSTWAQQKPANPSAEANAATQTDAKQTYESVCAACHGLDARGSERGPDIASKPEIVQKTDAELAQILANGKPAAGMPAFSSFGAAKLSAMVAYLRTLQGRGKSLVLPGDPEKGKALFFGKAECSQCHALAGQGGFFASDLSNYGGRLAANELRAKILNPDADLDPRRGLVHVVLPDGTQLTGAVRNENNFSIQLQTRDGAFHLLIKSELHSQSYTGTTGMPRDYRSTLTSAELNDVVSFVLRSVSENTKPSSGNLARQEDN